MNPDTDYGTANNDERTSAQSWPGFGESGGTTATKEDTRTVLTQLLDELQAQIDPGVLGEYGPEVVAFLPRLFRCWSVLGHGQALGIMPVNEHIPDIVQIPAQKLAALAGNST